MNTAFRPLLAQDATSRVAEWWNAAQPWLRDAWVEVMAHKIWYTTWVGLFICTFLMLRMLITRWGDTNVTRKALILSLLLHVVGGLFTTTVHIATHAMSATTDSRDAIPVRQIVPETAHRAGESDPRKKAGDRVWEKLPAPQTAPVTRQEKPERPLATAEAPRTSQPIETAAVPLPDLPVPTRPETSVEPVRSTPQTAPRVTAASQALKTDPADNIKSRPEATVGPTGPTRQSRQPVGLETPDIPQTARSGVRAEPASALPDPARELVSPNPAPLPAVALRRGTDSERRPIKPGLAPPGQPLGRTGLPGGDDKSVTLGKGNRSDSPFSRMARSSGSNSGSGDSGDAALPARSPPGSTNGSTREPGDLLATRLGTQGTGGGTMAPDDFAPRIVRGPEAGGGGPPGAGRGIPSAYRLRGPEQRKKSAIEHGATQESERSVELSLRWLANHQDPAGFWDADGFDTHCPFGNRCGGRAGLGQDPVEGTRTPGEHQQAGLEADAGVTSLAILAFLGAGYKHEEGPYADQLDRALRWLIRQQGEDGFLGGRANRYARMYCHGMATIALGEAYGMTHDETLRGPLTRAVQFIIDTQNSRDGGWRYVPGQISDMSIFGWQLMGLKSAQTAGLAVPKETMDRCIRFLIDQAEALKAKRLTTYGGLAAYRKYVDTQGAEQVEPPKPSMTAESLFCKQILGIKRTNPAVGEAIAYMEQNAPRRATEDLYYWYYGTLAMYHYGGPSWRQWNESVRELLVAEQRKDGHAAGSWDPRTPWGDFGGRVFSTAISTLTLEVYYRFLPMYRYDEKPREK